MTIIGLDLGTTTLSAVAVDGSTGQVLEVLNVPNAAQLKGRSWESLQDADRIAGDAMQLVQQLKRRHGAAAVGIDGQMHGVLYVDAQGRAVSPLHTWQDQRGTLRLDGGTYADALAQRTGHAVATGFGLVTHDWHTRNGSIPQQAARLCTVYDYVGMRLTGRAAPLCHSSTAASMGLFELDRMAWDVQAVERAGMDPAYLPEVTDDYALLGTDADGAAVAVGLGDNQASFIGSLGQMEDGLLINMGTGGQVSMLASAQADTPDVQRRPLGERRQILVGSVLCGGRAYALLESFLRSCAQLAGCADEPLYEAMNRIALDMVEAADLPAVDPRFLGTRSQPQLRGAVSGIGTQNFDAAHLIGGTLMGMAQEMHGLYEQMQRMSGSTAKRIIGSGNAIRRNPALRRAFEKVFGMPVSIPAHTEEAAFGAALAAMTAAGIKPSLAHAQRMIQYQK